VSCKQKQRRSAALVADAGEDTEGGAADDGVVRPARSAGGHKLNRVWSRPVRERRLRGPYDSPHSSDDDNDNNELEQQHHGATGHELETNFSAEDDEEMNGDDFNRLDTCQ